MSDHIEVTGTGSAAGTPDLSVVDAQIWCDADGVGTALADCATRVAAVLAEADALGIAACDRQTTDVGVTQRWGEQSTIVGYAAYQNLRFALRERDRVGDLLTTLANTAGDALRVNGIRFEISDRAALVRRAREAAFADARDKARQLADLAGRGLGAVTRVGEGSSYAGEPGPVFLRAVAADPEAGMPVEGGESVVQVSLTVRFALADGS